MKQMLKIEMERALKGAAFKIALIMGMIIVTVQFVKVGLHNALNPLEFFEYGGLTLPYTVIYTWIGGSFNVYYTLYIRLLPIMVVLPHAATYYTDRRTGIIRNYYCRTKKINYLIAKFTAVFTTGGIVAVLPLLVNLLATAMLLPSMIWNNNTFCYSANSMWSNILFTHPYVYYLLYFILQFICGGLLATVSLMVSLWVNNTFIVLLFPVVLCEFLNAASSWFPYVKVRAIAPYRLFSMSQMAPNYWESYVLFMVMIVVLDVVLYIWRGLKNDTF